MNTINIHRPPVIDQTRKRNYTFIFEDLELAFRKEQLVKITKDWNDGKEVEQISKEQKRHETEVLLALIYQSSRNRITRPFAYRIPDRS